MNHKTDFRILISPSTIGWPRAICNVRGDLGCLARHAKDVGYRAGDLSHRLEVPPRLLRRVFRDALGISLKNWLVEVRSVEVRQRLRGSESVEEIALTVGFSHAKELAREFRKIYGVTPSAYRSRVRRRETEFESMGEAI